MISESPVRSPSPSSKFMILVPPRSFISLTLLQKRIKRPKRHLKTLFESPFTSNYLHTLHTLFTHHETHTHTQTLPKGPKFIPIHHLPKLIFIPFVVSFFRISKNDQQQLLALPSLHLLLALPFLFSVFVTWSLQFLSPSKSL